MKKSSFYDNLLRKKLKKIEFIYIFYKALIMSKKVPFIFKEFISLKLNLLGAFSAQFTNSCVFTHRKRGSLYKFKMSRISLRTLGSSGYVVGFKKSSW